MRFSLLDRIEVLIPDERIEAVKCLSLAEEYLADHFPSAPVMPGVMMLEALVQASAWLIRFGHGFQNSLVTLKEARGTKYASFVEPGRILRVSAQIIGTDGHDTKLKAEGTVDGETAVASRLILTSASLQNSAPPDAASQAEAKKRDEFITQRLKRTFHLLYPAVDAALASS
jgi:3-hydroxyacyl-[acyl-carrier-protein] dehydratase